MAHAFEAATAAPSTGPVATADMLLAGLTAEQTQAVRHGTGPLLIMAGPGTGKTHTLIHRIAWLLAERLAEPWEILAVTFSVRAAGELRLRLSEMLGVELAGGVRAATFHSVCAQLLREHAELFGRTPEWTVYDQTEVRKTIEWLLSEHQRGQVGASAAATALPAAAEIEREVSLAKNRLLAPGEYQQSAGHPAGALIGEVWRELEAEMRRLNALAFDDLLVLAVRLLAERPYVLRSLRERWRWLLVDEVQDCQPAGTLITTPQGERVPIETVRPGDRVVSYTRRATRLRLEGSRVVSVSERPHDGDLVVVESSSGAVSRYAPNHICIAKAGGAFIGKTLVYVMRRGSNAWRVGVTSGYHGGKSRGHGTTGLTGRLREEDADAAWVLAVFDTKLDASMLEATVAAKFGLPQMCFMARGQLADQGRLDSFWAGFGDLSEGAHACLRAFGREPQYPIARRTLSNGTRDNYLLYTRASTIRACNLIDGMEFLDARALLQAPNQRSSRNGPAWTTATIRREHYRGPIYSLEVEPDHTYVADDIVTHNCNPAQLELASLLAGPGRNLTAVGDPDQVHLQVPVGRRARDGTARGPVSRPRADRAVAQPPQPGGDRHRRRPVRATQPPPRPAGADRGPRSGRPGEHRRVRQRARRSRVGDRHGRGRAAARHPARRGADPRPDRVHHRAAPARARARRDRAPGARRARLIRALGGPRRARLPHPAGQPAGRQSARPRGQHAKARESGSAPKARSSPPRATVTPAT